MTLHPGVSEIEIDSPVGKVRAYDSNGSNARPPVVLVHGTGSSTQKNFWALYPMLAFEHRVVGIDLTLPGDDSALTLEHYVQQVEALVESLGDSRGVVLVGYSLGAVVATALAAQRPDLLFQLVAIAGWIKGDRHQTHRYELYRNLKRQAPELLADFVQFASYGAPHVASRTAHDYDALVARVQASSPYDDRLLDMLESIDITDQAHSVSTRSLVIGCTNDQMVQVRHSRELFGAISDSRYAEVEAGHAVVHERPAELFALIDRFMQVPDEHEAGSVILPTDV